MTKWKFLKNMQVKRFLPISILLIGLFIAFIFGGADYISLETIRTNKEELKQFIQAKYTTSVIIFIFIYVVTTACSIPGAAILSLLGGYLYGVSLGAMFSLTGATIGACALYFAARTALGDTLKSRAGPAIVNMQDGFKKNSFSYMLFLRLVPVFPFFLVNLVPAFLQVRFSTYFFASVMGMAPGAIAFALTGVGLDKILLKGDNVDISILVTEELMFGLIGLGVLALFPVFYKFISEFLERKRIS
jgi:uncharacterized membrane protein YdjX (TVP38/TMEM64 family)